MLLSGIWGCTRTPLGDGEMLVRQLWTDFADCNGEAPEQWMTPGFQSVHADRARTRMEELELLLGLQLGDYVLDNFQSTQTDNVLVVTYSVSVRETIEGKVLSTAVAQRMSVFVYKGRHMEMARPCKSESYVIQPQNPERAPVYSRMQGRTLLIMY